MKNMVSDRLLSAQTQPQLQPQLWLHSQVKSLLTTSAIAQHANIQPTKCIVEEVAKSTNSDDEQKRVKVEVALDSPAVVEEEIVSEWSPTTVPEQPQPSSRADPTPSSLDTTDKQVASSAENRICSDKSVNSQPQYLSQDIPLPVEVQASHSSESSDMHIASLSDDSYLPSRVDEFVETVNIEVVTQEKKDIPPILSQLQEGRRTEIKLVQEVTQRESQSVSSSKETDENKSVQEDGKGPRKSSIDSTLDTTSVQDEGEMPEQSNTSALIQEHKSYDETKLMEESTTTSVSVPPPKRVTPEEPKQLSFLDYFDPKFMFKEYNLRRNRKPPPLEQPPPKKQKLKTVEVPAITKSPSTVTKDQQSASEMTANTAQESAAHTKVESTKRQRSPELEGPEQPAPKKAKVATKMQKLSCPQNVSKTTPESSGGANSNAVNSETSQPKTVDEESSRKKHGKDAQTAKVAKASDKKSEREAISIYDFNSQLDAGEKAAVSKSTSRRRSSPMKKSKKKQSETISLEENEATVGTICFLCGQKEGARSLGFLYGPYKCKDDLTADQTLTCTANRPAITTENTQDPVDGKDENKTTDLWVHEDCAVWAPGVCLVGGQLKGLQEAVRDGRNMVSSY